MTVHLKNIKESPEISIHSVPCKIHADTKAKIDLFFKPTVQDNELTASFRGYPLSGVEIEIPRGYKGAVFSISENSNSETKNYNCVGNFNKMTFWNWNKIPSKSDPFIGAIHWLTLSKSIHEPVES